MDATIKNNLSKKFSKTTIVIHWLSFLAFLALVPLGFIMSDLEPSAQKLSMYKIHSIVGIIVLLLTLARVFVFFKHERPADLKTGSKFNDKLAVWIHNAFYFIILLLTFSGLAILVQGGLYDAYTSNDYNLMPKALDIPPLKAHGALAFLLIALFVFHVAGVIKHYVLTKENTLKRIL